MPSSARLRRLLRLTALVCALATPALFLAGGTLSPHATLALATVAVGLVATIAFAASLHEGSVRLLADEGPAGILTRRLALAATALPLGTGLVAALLVDGGAFDGVTGLVAAAAIVTVAGFALLARALPHVAQLEARREAADATNARLTATLQEQAARLQETIAVRTQELRETNAQLRASSETNARLALVASHTINGVAIADATGRLEWVNAAYERLSGYATHELKGTAFGDLLIGTEADPEAAERLLASLQAGKRTNVELRLRAKDGQARPLLVDLEPVRDRDGRLINFIAIGTDLGPHLRARQHVQTLNRRFELATRAAALGIWEWSPDDGVFRADESALRLHGIETAPADSSDWTETIHPDDRNRTLAALIAPGPNQALRSTRYRCVRANDGLIRRLEACAIAQTDADGRLIGVTGTVRDTTAEHESTQQLERLNERLRFALESTRYGVWEYDLVADRLHWDERMFRIYGLSPDAFTGNRNAWVERLHPEDRDAARDLVQRVIAENRSRYDTSFRILTTAGEVRHIEAHGYMHRDAEGRPLRLVGLNRDITSEQTMAEALHLAEQRWQLALQGSNDAVWDWNLQTGHIFHDEQWARMLGYSLEELPPGLEGWRQLVHPDDLAPADAAAEDHLAQRTEFYLHEYRMRAKDGSWKWILDRGKVVARTPEGRPARMVGTHSDITLRKHLEQRLRQIEELASQVSRLAQIGAWALDLKTSHLMWSDEVHRIHGVPADYKPTLPDALAFFPPEARETFTTALENTALHGTPFDLELAIEARHGRRWVRVIGGPERHRGEITGVQGAIQDITSRHESDAARRQLEIQLFQAQKMETLGTLAGGIAHDFNNLLTGILGYHELAVESIPEDNPARPCLEEARKAGMRARELVEQILTFGRQSAGEGLTPIDLAHVIEDARRFLRATLPSNITIEVDVDPHCPQVLADATQMHQVILNLGSNAAHAMRAAGGTLRLSLRPAEIAAGQSATLGALTAGGYVRLSVADTGHGMDEATLRRVFDPFFTTKDTREGTGLGLAVVHGIVRAHRGTVDVESAHGVGSTFHVYLPAAVGGAAPVPPPAPEAPRGEGEMIFVVDDEEIVGRCTRMTLESKGFRATTFLSAEACLEALRKQPGLCGAIVTDQTMPGMQGTELAAEVRKFAPRLPVVIMSGYFSKISPHALDELGQVELLAKPFTPTELVGAINRAIVPGATSPAVELPSDELDS